VSTSPKQTFFRRIAETHAPAATILIRLAVGAVFLSEGIQKFLFPSELGVGRFAQIGIPAPALMAPFVGAVEIGCGLLVLVGLATRVAALLLIADMLVAFASTKVPILLKSGIWKMAHEARTDLAMLLGALFLFVVGAGASSLDARLTSSKTRHDA
jgi:putative oxidoreductase